MTCRMAGVVATAVMVLVLVSPTEQLKSRTYEEFAAVDENRTLPPTEWPASRRLVVTTLLEPPYMMLKEHGVFLTGKDRFEGFLADMLLAISGTVGFDYEIRLARDGRESGRAENGTWQGMIGEIHRKEADLAVGALTVHHDDMAAAGVDFTEPFMTLRSAAVIQKPRKKRQPRNTNHHNAQTLQAYDKLHYQSDEYTNSNNKTEQHRHHRKRRKSSKRRTRTRIRSLEELLSSDYQYGVIRGSPTERLLRTSTDPAHRALWSRINTFWPSAFVSSVQEGVQRARREDYAFLLDLPAAQYAASRRPCDLYTTAPLLDAREYALAMQRGDPLRPLIDAQIAHLRMSGRMQTLYERWWASECDSKRRDAADGGSLPTTAPSPWRFGTAAEYGGEHWPYSGGVAARGTDSSTRATVALVICVLVMVRWLHGC